MNKMRAHIISNAKHNLEVLFGVCLCVSSHRAVEFFLRLYYDVPLDFAFCIYICVRERV